MLMRPILADPADTAQQYARLKYMWSQVIGQAIRDASNEARAVLRNAEKTKNPEAFKARYLTPILTETEYWLRSPAAREVFDNAGLGGHLNERLIATVLDIVRHGRRLAENGEHRFSFDK